MKIFTIIRVFVLLGCVGLSGVANAQLYISNSLFATKQDALVFVNGDVTYTGNVLQTVDHQGLLEMKGNWYNSTTTDKKVFTDGSKGTVLLSGALQTFNGSNTRFPNLTLAGTNKKQQFTTIEVRDTLNLTDRELDVNGNTASMLSRSIAAVKYNQGGYVNTSASNKGWLIRNMNANSEYVFPLGNNDGSLFRFRPLVISAQQSGNVYGQFQNYNPANDGYPVSIKANDVKSVDDHWYHTLTTDATTGNSVNVQLPYNSIADGQFGTMVKWDNVTTHEWEKQASNAPVLNNVYNTNDYIFNTSTAIVLGNGVTVPVHLGGENDNSKFNIPNVITPNADGYNDKWVIDGVPSTSTMEVVIFNRWNNVVYQSKNYDNSWDGSKLNAGTYFYVLKITAADGTRNEYKGYIMLMR